MVRRGAAVRAGFVGWCPLFRRRFSLVFYAVFFGAEKKTRAASPWLVSGLSVGKDDPTSPQDHPKLIKGKAKGKEEEHQAHLHCVAGNALCYWNRLGIFDFQVVSELEL